jgi:hypothetical protein
MRKTYFRVRLQQIRTDTPEGEFGETPETEPRGRIQRDPRGKTPDTPERDPRAKIPARDF